jgi:hypothetical protein
MSTTNFWRRALTVAVFLLAASSAVAQVQTGNVFGSTVDEQGSALPGVTVTLSGIGAPQVFVTDGQGRFRFLSLAPGRYQLSAALEGFATVEYPNVNVSVGRNTEIEVTMSSAVEDVITVTAESPLLDERKITTGTTVSEVELEKIPTARDPWVILQQAPGVLVDRVNVGGNESGQQSQFISPGTNNNNSAWAVDGVVITDMGAIGSSPTYYNFDSFEEMQVNTGGSDVTLATGGVTMNMVTRRGTNEWRGSGRYLLTDDTIDQADLSFDSGELGKAGPWSNNRSQPLFQQGNEIVDVKDFGAELGGPVIKDRLWIWGSWGTQEIDLLTLRGVRGFTGPGTHDFTELPSYAVKLNAQVASNNSGIAFYHFGDKKKSGRNAGPTREPPTTWNQAGGTPIYKLEDTHIFNSNFYLTGMASFVDGGFSLTPLGDPNGDSTVWNESLVWQNNFLLYDTLRPQEQAKIDGDYFFNAGSSNHNLKFGVGLRNAVVTSFSSWEGRDGLVGIEPGDPDPFLGTGFARADRSVENEMDYTNFFIQDTMTLGNLTANFGIRYDLQEGKINSTVMPDHRSFPQQVPGGVIPAIDMPFEWESITPRLGLTYALGEERQTLLRASYSRFADQLHSGIVEQINPGSYRYGYFYWDDANHDHKITPNEVGDFYFYSGYDPNNPDEFVSVNSVDSSLDSPITDELVLGVEHALMPEFVIGLSATYRIYSDIMQSDPLVFDGPATGLVGRDSRRDDFVLFDHLVGTLPNGQTYRVPLFKLKPGLTTFDGNNLYNGDREQEYLGLSFTFNKRLSNNWLLRGHFTQSDWEWDVPGSAIVEPLITTTGTFEDGAQVISGSGTGSGSKGGIFISPGWSFDISGLYQVAPQRPWAFNVAANVNGREGYAVPYAVAVPGSAYGDGLGGRTTRVTSETDSFRHDDIIIFNGRIEKEFNFGEFGLTLGLDGFNLTNESYTLQRQISLSGNLETTGPPDPARPGLGRRINNNAGDFVTEVVNPRIFRIGARISFR